MSDRGKDYNWWTDPANAETVKKLSWWNQPENKTFIQIPISIIESSGYWCIGANSDTEAIFGEHSLPISAQGESRQDAIDQFFKTFRIFLEHEAYEVAKYQRWVPFRRGSWKRIGGKWFCIYGLNFYFRYGKDMKGGWYIPFTKLNISFHNEWKIFNKYYKNKK